MFAASKTDGVSGGYQISRSLRFNSADTTNLNRTFASAGNRRTFTLSFWLKRSRVGVDYEGFFASGNGTDQIRFENIDQLRFSLNSTASGDFVTTQVFRDVSAWYHIVFAVDTTQATSTNRVKIYVNGSQITSFTTSSYPTLNYDCNFNNNVSHRLGIANDTSYPFNGYITETYLIDGQALTPSSFGETNAQTGVWQPKAYSGSYGTNGFYLNFSDNSNTTAATLGKDYSGNGNNWTPNNFSVTAGAGNDSLVDSPTSYGTDTGVGGTVRGNYATLNPLSKGPTCTLSNGNLDLATTNNSGNSKATIGITSGKWYWECTLNTGTNTFFTGLVNSNESVNNYVGQTANSWGYYSSNGQKWNGSGVTYGSSYTNGDVIGVAFDADAGTLVFYKNNTSQGTAFTGLTSGPYFPASSDAGNGSNSTTSTFNFGQRPFAYTAPSGYKALCTQNLPTPTIGATTATQAGKYFNTVTWTGDSTNPRTITGVGFQPDLVWAKGRSAATSNFLQDAVRGVTSTNSRTLVSNNTDAETNYYTLNGGVTAFASDGFTTSGGSTNANLNNTGSTFVAWNWKANGSGSTNTSGSITSTVSANTTSGFSVVTYTGTGSNATVGHGLGVAPKLIITKNRGAYDWFTYHEALGNNKYVTLNTTGAAVTDANVWQSSNPTTSVFYVGANLNLSSNTYVNYCFAEVAGYSKFGSYNGNSSSDGPFIFTGFRPAYVMIKLSSAAGESWYVMDNKRNTANSETQLLFPNLSNAELSGSSGLYVDFNANGFKVRDSGSSFNTSGATYIFAAFAETPQKFSLAR